MGASSLAGKKNSAESCDNACCGEVLQADDGKGEKAAPNSEKDAQSACRLGDPLEPGSSGEHLQMTKMGLSSSRRLNASSSEEEFYPGEEKVTIKTLGDYSCFAEIIGDSHCTSILFGRRWL